MDHLCLVSDALVLLAKELLYVVQVRLAVRRTWDLAVLKDDVWDLAVVLWVTGLLDNSIANADHVPNSWLLPCGGWLLEPVVVDL